MTAWPNPAAFWDYLLDTGRELHIRGNGGLHIWPARGKAHLTDAEREYLHEHRDQLKELVRSTGLRETTVVWQPPGQVDGNCVDHPPVADSAPEPVCDYCHAPLLRCEEIKHTRLDAFRALHHLDPAEIERRNQVATAEMLESLRRGLGPWL